MPSIGLYYKFALTLRFDYGVYSEVTKLNKSCDYIGNKLEIYALFHQFRIFGYHIGTEVSLPFLGSGWRFYQLPGNLTITNFVTMLSNFSEPENLCYRCVEICIVNPSGTQHSVFVERRLKVSKLMFRTSVMYGIVKKFLK